MTLHSITKSPVERVAVEVVVVREEVVRFPRRFLMRFPRRFLRRRGDRFLRLSAPEQRLPERDLVLGVGEQARSPPRVGADVGAERLPRVGLLSRGLARDAPPRRPQRAAVEGQGAVRFRFRRRRDGDGSEGPPYEASSPSCLQRCGSSAALSEAEAAAPSARRADGRARPQAPAHHRARGCPGSPRPGRVRGAARSRRRSSAVAPGPRASTR